VRVAPPDFTVTTLFVYGTRMPGDLRWPALRPYAVATEPATAPGRVWDTGRGYPAARFDDGSAEVRGVVVTVAPARMAEAVAALDRIEAEGVLYRRVSVVTSAGPALSYEWLGSTEGMRALPIGWPGTGA
jgi:gamma-glutamylcyclotransferase (GGCT)/AIG2-like uncharacterized protein YtfP